MPPLREMSVDSLEVAYKRLGIKFDHFDGESMYGGQVSDKVSIYFYKVLRIMMVKVTNHPARQL